MIAILNALFPKTIAAIRNKAYETGRFDTAAIYVEIIRNFKKENKQ